MTPKTCGRSVGWVGHGFDWVWAVTSVCQQFWSPGFPVRMRAGDGIGFEFVSFDDGRGGCWVDGLRSSFLNESACGSCACFEVFCRLTFLIVFLPQH
jgi:hypothetical protein